MNYTFTDKETYLAYRSDWKAKYKQLSNDIRNQKRIIRSKRLPSGMDYYTLFSMKTNATNMLEELKGAKQEANRQYLTTKQQLIAA